MSAVVYAADAAAYAAYAAYAADAAFTEKIESKLEEIAFQHMEKIKNV